MENNIESMELEEMRQQMTALKKQLDEQLQLNESRLQSILKNEQQDIYGFGLWYLVGAVLAAIILPFVFYHVTGGQYAIGIVVSVLCLVEGVFHYYKSRHIMKTDLSCASLKETTTNLIETKRQIAKFTIIDNFILIPILFFWMGCITWTLYHPSIYRIILVTGICYVIGVSIELYVISRQRRNINKMIDTLQEGTE